MVILVGVIMQRAHGDSFTQTMEEEALMRMLGRGGGFYEYGDIIEIHYENGYIKRNRLSGDILKAVYFCQ